MSEDGRAHDRDGAPIKRGDYVRVVRAGAKSGRIACIRDLVFLPGNTPPLWLVKLTDDTDMMSNNVCVICDTQLAEPAAPTPEVPA